MKPPRFRWTSVALGIILGISAWIGVKCDPAPPEWREGISNRNILYTEQEDTSYLPVLSNGYLAHTIGGEMARLKSAPWQYLAKYHFFSRNIIGHDLVSPDPQRIRYM